MGVSIISLTDNIKPDIMNEPVTFQKLSNNYVVAETHEKIVQILNETPDIGWAPAAQVKVDCTCDDFKYRRAYVLWKHDALLFPDKYVLEPPKKTNPGMDLSACKHVGRVLQELLEKNGEA